MSNKKKIRNIKTKDVKVRTSKKSVATVKIVKKAGKVTGYKVTARKAGKTTITIKVKKGTYKGTYKCKITVKKKPVKKTPAPKKPATAKPSASPAPTGTPAAQAKLAITVSDTEGNPVNGATIKIFRGEELVSEIPNATAAFETEGLDSGMYSMVVSMEGYETKNYENIIVNGTGTISYPVKLEKDLTNPIITKTEIDDKGHSIKLTMSKKVTAVNASTTVTKDGISIELAAPVMSADGRSITITTTTGEKLPDGAYKVQELKGITDLAGNPVSITADDGEVTKETTYDTVKITSEGFAPSPGQSVSYKIIDNYKDEYDGLETLPAGTDAKLRVSVTNKGPNGNLTVPIIKDSSDNTFDLSSLKKGYHIEVKIEITINNKILTDTQTLELGDGAEAQSFDEPGAFSLKQESGVGTDNYTVDYGIDTNPIHYLKDSGKRIKIQLSMLDQYGNMMQSKEEQVVTLVSDNPEVIAILDASGRETNLVRETGTDDGTTLWNAIKIKNVGTTTLHAYLDNGQECEMKVTVKPPTLTRLKKVKDVECTAKEQVYIPASYFTFTYDEDNPGAYKTPISDLSVNFVSASSDAAAHDIEHSILANPDGSFRGLNICAEKEGIYILELSSRNEKQSAEFTVTATQAEEATDIQLDQTSLDIKKGGVGKPFGLQLINKFGDPVSKKTKKELQEIIQWKLLSTGGVVIPDTIDELIGIDYLKEDGTSAVDTDKVTKLSLSAKNIAAGSYWLEASLSNGQKAVLAVTVSAAAVGSVSIEGSITADDLLIAGDTDCQYIPLIIKDEDGEEMEALDANSLTLGLKKTSDLTNDIKIEGFVTPIKARMEDGKIVEDAINGTFNALKINPGKITSNADAVTYSVEVKYDAGNIVSDSKTIRVCEIRRLDRVVAEPAAVEIIEGNQKEVLITSYDQYNTVMEITPSEINPVETTAKAVVGNSNTDKAYPVTIEAVALGTVTKTFSVKNPAADNGTGADITKSVSLDITVKGASALKNVTVQNTSLILHPTDFEGTKWSRIMLKFAGYDDAGQEMAVSAENLAFDCETMPTYINFDESTGEISVRTADLPENTLEPKNIPVTIRISQQRVGSFTINFAPTLPTPAEITEDDADNQTVKVANDGTVTNISDKKFEVTTSYGDTVEITATELTNWKSWNSNVVVGKNGDGKVTISTQNRPAAGTVASIEAKFAKNGGTKTVFFDVEVVEGTVKPGTEPTAKPTVSIQITGLPDGVTPTVKVTKDDGTEIDIKKDENGNYVTDALDNGSYTVTVTAEGYVQEGEAAFTIDEGKAPENAVAVSMKPARNVVIIVKDINGEILTGAVVEYKEKNSSDEEITVNYDNGYKVSGLAVGKTYTFTAKKTNSNATMKKEVKVESGTEAQTVTIIFTTEGSGSGGDADV